MYSKNISKFKRQHQTQGTTTSMSDLEHRRTQPTETNPDIAHTTEELKSNYARPSVLPPEANKDKTRRIGHLPLMAGGAAVAIAAVAGGYFATRGGEKQSTDPIDTEPSVSAPAVPGETEVSSPEVEGDLSKYGIEAEKYQTFEDVVTAFYQKSSEYQASAKTYDEQGNSKYLEALFGTNWETNPELSEYVGDLRDSSVIVSTNHFATGENGDTEYERTLEITGIEDVKESADQVAGVVFFHETDNIMDTVLAMNADHNLDSYGQFHLTFDNVDGVWQVTELDNVNNN